MTRPPLSLDQLAACTGATRSAATPWVEPLNAAMDLFSINTPERQAAFLAQLGHESGGLRYRREIWGPTPAQRGYEGRVDLGNTQPGDGLRYLGRGPIQITGRGNYRACREGLSKYTMRVPDFEAEPEKLETEQWGSAAAAWFWTDFKSLNPLADASDFVRITRRINGGLNGLDDRTRRWVAAKNALGVA